MSTPRASLIRKQFAGVLFDLLRGADRVMVHDQGRALVRVGDYDGIRKLRNGQNTASNKKNTRSRAWERFKVRLRDFSIPISLAPEQREDDFVPIWIDMLTASALIREFYP